MQKGWVSRDNTSLLHPHVGAARDAFPAMITVCSIEQTHPSACSAPLLRALMAPRGGGAPARARSVECVCVCVCLRKVCLRVLTFPFFLSSAAYSTMSSSAGTSLTVAWTPDICNAWVEANGGCEVQCVCVWWRRWFEGGHSTRALAQPMCLGHIAVVLEMGRAVGRFECNRLAPSN